MKTLQTILLAAIVVFTFSCKNETEPEVKIIETAVSKTASADDANATYAKAEFTIEGMTCAMGCAKTIEKKLAKMDGVKSATVDFDKRLAMVEYNDAKVTPANLAETVVKVSDTYKVMDMKSGSEVATKKASCKKTCDSKTKASCAKKDSKDCQKGCCAKTEDKSSKAKKA